MSDRKYRIVENCGEYTIQVYSEQTYKITRYSFKLVDEPGWVYVTKYGNFDIYIPSNEMPPFKTLAEAQEKVNQFIRGVVIHEIN